MALNHFDRRTFLRVGSLTLFGHLSFAEVLRLQAAAVSSAPAAKKQDLSVILIWCAGGVSQMETWDPKPRADEKYRGAFGVIPTNVDGIVISEHLPMTARVVDKVTIIRSMTAKDAVHESAQAFMLTGHAPLPGLLYPAVGSIVANELPARNELPPYVLTGGAAAAWEQATFLGPKNNPFVAGNPNEENYRVRD